MPIVYDNFSGSDCSGTDKTTSRTLFVGDRIDFIVVERKTLRPDVDYSVDDQTVTFLIRIDNRYKITIFRRWFRPVPSPPIKVPIDKKIRIFANVLFELEIEVTIEAHIEKDIGIDLELSASVEKEVNRSLEITVNIQKEIEFTLKLESKLDHSKLIEYLEAL